MSHNYWVSVISHERLNKSEVRGFEVFINMYTRHDYADWTDLNFKQLQFCILLACALINFALIKFSISYARVRDYVPKAIQLSLSSIRGNIPKANFAMLHCRVVFAKMLRNGLRTNIAKRTSRKCRGAQTLQKCCGANLTQMLRGSLRINNTSEWKFTPPRLTLTYFMIDVYFASHLLSARISILRRSSLPTSSLANLVADACRNDIIIRHESSRQNYRRIRYAYLPFHLKNLKCSRNENRIYRFASRSSVTKRNIFLPGRSPFAIFHGRASRLANMFS